MNLGTIVATIFFAFVVFWYICAQLAGATAPTVVTTPSVAPTMVPTPGLLQGDQTTLTAGTYNISADCRGMQPNNDIQVVDTTTYTFLLNMSGGSINGTFVMPNSTDNVEVDTICPYTITHG